MVARAQIVEKEGMGDKGFEPVTSTVWRRQWSKQRHRK
jgi:hypothetical protein